MISERLFHPRSAEAILRGMAGVDFKPGDRVRIIEGNFEGFEGVVLAPNEGEAVPRTAIYPVDTNPFTAVWVTINIFGRDTKLKIAPNLLESA